MAAALFLDGCRNASRLLVSLFAFVLLWMGSSSVADATHFRYGHVTWKPVDTSGRVEFTVTCAFRNGYGVSSVGQYFIESIGSTTLDFGDGGGTSSADWHVIGFTGLCGELGSTDVVIARLDPGRTGVDRVFHTYATSAAVIAQIASCCRISAPLHINNPDGEYRVLADVRPAFASLGNSSPVSGMPPIIQFAKNAVNTFLVPASDANGDPLSFRLATATEAASGAFVQPGPPDAPNPLTINASSGLITWDTTGATVNPPTTQTLYSCQVVVQDAPGSTNRVAVDFMICLVDSAGCNAPMGFDYPPTPPDGSTITVCAESQLSFAVQASDPNAGDTVQISNLGLPGGASFNCGAPGNPTSCTFSWTPTPADIGSHVVQFQTTDGCNIPVTTSVNIVVEGCVPVPTATWGQIKSQYR